MRERTHDNYIDHKSRQLQLAAPSHSPTRLKFGHTTTARETAGSRHAKPFESGAASFLEIADTLRRAAPASVSDRAGYVRRPHNPRFGVVRERPRWLLPPWLPGMFLRLCPSTCLPLPTRPNSSRNRQLGHGKGGSAGRDGPMARARERYILAAPSRSSGDFFTAR